MLRKIVSSLIVLIFLSAMSLIGSGSNIQEPAKESLDQRLGSDDGAALAILFGANMRGILETCD
jgi:hypothetical protein